MFDNPIISFYATKKGASCLTPLIVGLYYAFTFLAIFATTFASDLICD
jgi:hypothetical protein